MIKFTIKGIQYKHDEHSTPLSPTYKGFNMLVIPLSEAKSISNIVVECAEVYNIVEVWHELCNASKYFNCKMTCWHHDCQFIVNPESDPKIITGWAYDIIEHRLLTFGPEAPKLTKEYITFSNRYNSIDTTINDLYAEINIQKQKKASLVYDRFASNIEDTIDMKDIDPGTPKVVKRSINRILKMLIGICKKSNEKYLIDFEYELGNVTGHSPNSRKFRVRDHIFQEWLDSLDDMKGNYGHNFELVAEYIQKYLMKKLNLEFDRFQYTWYHYLIILLKNHE